MAEQLGKTGRELNATFLPASLLRKTENKLASSLASKYEFEKTTGNAFIIIDPPEIKFAGYELDKIYTASVRVINRAPVPQRIAILQPEEGVFQLKTNKKGSIASGMSQTLTIIFRSSEFKYQHDVVRITTETENFVIPLYAYPSLPDLRAVFPKIIDFGSVDVKEPTTYYYPIKNTVPLNFEFEFNYQKECQEISISPLSGIIPAQETLTVEITFLPQIKCTYTSQVTLSIHQFDFKPLPITIMGSGTMKVGSSLPQRVKSSRLAPIKEGEQGKKSNLLRRKQSGEALNLNATGNFNPNATANANLNATGNLGTTSNVNIPNIRKTNIRTGYSKLISAKKTIIPDEDGAKTMNPAKIAQREYQNRFGRIQDLDKEKEIKFASFLGDRAMTQQQIDFQREVANQMAKVRSNALQNRCINRFNAESYSEVQVQYKILNPKELTWDDKKNDEHHNRRQALLRFMNAGTRVILKYRLAKRLGKIRQFLSGCKNKQEVRKKIEESHAKAIDQQQGTSFTDDMSFNFGFDSLQPAFFPLQFEENKDGQNALTFKPQGRASFDDLAQIKELKTHRVDQFKLSEIAFPPEYFNHSRIIPKPRSSGEDEWCHKGSALPGYHSEPLSSVFSLPIKAPAHHFIFDNHALRRYKNYANRDEKDPEEYLQQNGAIQDEFEGWTGGEFEILKAKFSRNIGFQFHTFSSYNYSSDRHPLPPLATLGQSLPYTIQAASHEDTIEQGDSDEEKVMGIPIESGQKLLQQIESTNADLKQRRAKGQIRNPQRELKQTIEKSLSTLKDKAVGEYVGKVKQANRWIDQPQHRFLI